jgi:hypothetical protein
VPPQCQVNFLDYFNRNDLISVRWFYFSMFILLMVLGIMAVGQHLYYGLFFKFTWSNLPKMVAAIFVSLAAMCQAIRNGVNPQGTVFGFPDAYSVISMQVSF